MNQGLSVVLNLDRSTVNNSRPPQPKHHHDTNQYHHKKDPDAILACHSCSLHKFHTVPDR